MEKTKLDALASEYQKDYGDAGNYFDSSDFVNQPLVQSKVSVLSLGFPKEFFRFGLSDITVFDNNITDPSLITKDA